MHHFGVGGGRLSWMTNLEQLIEKRSVVDDGLAKLLRARLTLLVANGNRASVTVRLHHGWMIDRDISSTALKVLHRVAAFDHQVAHEAVGFHHHAPRIVDEPGL